MSRTPHVLLCCEHYPPSVGGVQEVMRQIAERLVETGVDVTVATSHHPARGQDVLCRGVRVIGFPVSGNLARGMTGPLDKYRAFLQQGQFDALMIKAAQQWTFDAALDVLPGLDCRKLFIPCGFSGLKDPLYADYYRRMPERLRDFDGLIFYASDYQDIAFARRHGLHNLLLIPNGVDEREFVDPGDHDIRRRLGIDPAHAALLSVGSKIAAKGHWEVLRAFRRAHLTRPTTLIINANSPGHRVQRLRRQIKHLATGHWSLDWLARRYSRDAAHKRVLIVDLPRSDLVDLYKAADLFVLASHVEYSPLVLFEAAAAGTPFLASAAGNSAEIARWTGGGQVLPQASSHSARLSVPALARQMEQMLSDPERLHAMGQAARAAIWQKGFTWKDIARQYRQALLDPEPEVIAHLKAPLEPPEGRS